jgi:hypothetical protein
MIPPFDPDGDLPPGLHWASWDEIAERFGGTERRVALLDGLRRALVALKAAGCRTAYIDGSFVTTKEDPRDFDGCWEPDGVDLRRLDPTLYDFAVGRRAQKRKYGGELFPANFIANAAGFKFFDLFQTESSTGKPKGMVAINLEDLP